jgi:hypothetical protein
LARSSPSLWASSPRSPSDDPLHHTSVGEAVRLLADDGIAIAGGTVVVPEMQDGVSAEIAARHLLG